MIERGMHDLTSNAAYGIVSWFRTGNIIIDMAVAMLIPMIIRSIFDGHTRDHLAQFFRRLYKMIRRSDRDECIRTISYTSKNSHRGDIFDQRNELLQKALCLYFTEVAQVKFKGKAQVALTAMQDTRWNCDRPDRYNPLANYRLTWLAPESEWVEMDSENKIEFRQWTNSQPSGDNNDSKSTKEQIVYELRCTQKEAPKKIDALINKAVDWYTAELQRQRDDSRYLYVMNCPERFAISNTDKDDDAYRYKRYKLSDHKKFDSLFFEGKDDLLSVLNDFEQKNGKYAISGYPHKLGLLLHGPPGTGKTSLIKALAQQTGRSIINIPLAQIKTNQMLMDIFYDLKLKVDGYDTPQYQFKDILFVIEDVDAASKIVLRRDKSMGGDKDLSNEEELTPEQLTAMLSASSRAARMNAGPKEESVKSDAVMEGPKGPTMADMMGDLLKPKADELNLAGLLNVLDGVVDTPGRLLILTSNHPEKLDPALIRPGRVDRLIHLGYLKAEQACQMLAHYFGEEISKAQRQRVEEILAESADAKVTPAVLECMCARHETVDELLTDLAAEWLPEAARDVSPNSSTSSSKMTGTTDGATTIKKGGYDEIDIEPLPLPTHLVRRQSSGAAAGA
jgi:chaperone BCS1